MMEKLHVELRQQRKITELYRMFDHVLIEPLATHKISTYILQLNGFLDAN